MMTIGSMFAGIGGLDLACEWALDARTVWQLDQVGAKVRRRHWPDALQIEGDVTAIDPATLPRVGILCGGFPCQDLSCAGTGAGLEGKRSGLYRQMLRYARALAPALVVMENVPGLLKYREQLEADWRELGYGLTWVKVRALDAGAPHLRARVFVIAERGALGKGLLEAPRGGAWTAEASERTWATVCSRDHRSGGGHAHSKGGRCLPCEAVRTWPTATSTDHKASGAVGYSTESGRHSGTTLTDAAVRYWPTAMHSDAADVKTQGPGVPSLNFEARQRDQRPGKRLNPDWVECLMGFPPGWTRTQGALLVAERAPRWPRGRYPEGWDRSVQWPGFPWEPSRTLPDGPPAKGRPARLKGIGNAVCPQEGALALRTWAEPVQVTLWGAQ